MSTSVRWTQEQYEEHMRGRGEPRRYGHAIVTRGNERGTYSAPIVSKKQPKYRNTRVTVDGKKFDSKLEARYYKLLCMQWQSTQNKISQGIKLRCGDLLWFVRQVSIELQGGVRYRLDFQVVRVGCHDSYEPCCQHIELVDCKGVLTPASANKIKQAESIMHAKIILANEADVRGITL